MRREEDSGRKEGRKEKQWGYKREGYRFFGIDDEESSRSSLTRYVLRWLIVVFYDFLYIYDAF